ncbi:MAG: alkaline shock response membrane anchor protein AmaP [Lentisphaeria bacterium]|nr:alkaline shock response membrane anchor protein AmaP [Lentisphaeria bacterium]
MNFCQYYDYFCNFIKSLNANDFNKGYAAGIGVVFLVLLILLVIRLIFKIIFRRRKCSEIIAPAADGDVTISLAALEDTVRGELASFPSVKVNKIRLYRIRHKYQLNLICEYDGKDGGLPELTQKIKKSVKDMAHDFFGIDSLRKINLKFERLSRDRSLIITKESSADTQIITPYSAEEAQE